jgi:glycosyltransferase involved in cell wall biosynthesis
VYSGLLPHAEGQAAMRAAAALVVPSTWDEVCPMVVVEALSHARPVLATAMGGLPFLVGAGDPDAAGWLVEPDVTALAAVLPRVSAEAPELAAAARRRYLERFAPDVVLAALVEAYRSTAAAAVARTP